MRTCRPPAWSTITRSTASAAPRYASSPDGTPSSAARAPLLDRRLHAATVVRVGGSEVRDRARDDVPPRDVREAAGDVRDQPRAFVLLHHAIEQSRLHEVVVFGVADRRVAARIALDREPLVE